MERFLTSVAGKATCFATLLTAVFALFAAVFALTGQAPAALLILPPAGFPTGMPDDIRVLRWDKTTAVVTSENPDYVRRLYRAGTLLVLPIRKSGCLSLRPAKEPTPS